MKIIDCNFKILKDDISHHTMLRTLQKFSILIRNVLKIFSLRNKPPPPAPISPIKKIDREKAPLNSYRCLRLIRQLLHKARKSSLCTASPALFPQLPTNLLISVIAEKNLSPITQKKLTKKSSGFQYTSQCTFRIEA